jgi:hypothetical protein
MIRKLIKINKYKKIMKNKLLNNNSLIKIYNLKIMKTIKSKMMFIVLKIIKF